ncbi:hypothetical protein EDB85DRAFT_1900653 [Lactarius pseudohatsudake]|nr:hypothetical protein EDB85DRAFT_1900653 [Lactarius pseudohatsudake]
MTRILDLAFIFGRRTLCIFLIESEVLWIVTLSLPLRCRPLTTLGHPPPTAIAESQWGELRSDAFGTDARVAGSISSGPVLLPLVSVGEEEGGAGREWQACPSSGLGCGATLYMLALSSSSSYPIILVSELEAPMTLLHYLFLRRRPLTTLGRPPPTTVVESQWGEPRSDAFGTDARVAGSISSGPVLLPLWATISTRRLLTVNPDLAPSVGSGKRKAGQGRAGAFYFSRIRQRGGRTEDRGIAMHKFPHRFQDWHFGATFNSNIDCPQLHFCALIRNTFNAPKFVRCTCSKARDELSETLEADRGHRARLGSRVVATRMTTRKGVKGTWVEKGESKVKESEGKRETTRDERSGVVGVCCTRASVEVKRGSKRKKENGDKESNWLKERGRRGDAGGIDEAH